MNNQNSTITKLAETALLAALCYVAFTFLQIKMWIKKRLLILMRFFIMMLMLI